MMAVFLPSHGRIAMTMVSLTLTLVLTLAMVPLALTLVLTLAMVTLALTLALNLTVALTLAVPLTRPTRRAPSSVTCWRST